MGRVSPPIGVESVCQCDRVESDRGVSMPIGVCEYADRGGVRVCR